ncbi:MAG: sodium/panthothenate symporter, partial [Schwartzia sp.]|nr:sodium/panthothenate symporter [Schwartzia sp. (in: firmicutes)]
MQNEGNLMSLLPLLLFMSAMIGIGFYVRHKQEQGGSGNFVQQYFIGNHDLGGFVLAMTTVAT